MGSRFQQNDRVRLPGDKGTMRVVQVSEDGSVVFCEWKAEDESEFRQQSFGVDLLEKVDG